MKLSTSQKRIYLDHAATTRIDDSVLACMLPFLKEGYGNPSSLHTIGREAKSAVENARSDVAKELNASPEEILFTGSGTESDNLAVLGAARSMRNEGEHIVISNIEHKAVLESVKELSGEGFEVTYARADGEGIVAAEEVGKCLRDDTVLVSVMYANNEIGTVQPIREIAELISKRRGERPVPLFHTDACQASPFLSLDVEELGVDLLTLNGGKMYGPKGVGCLYKRRGIRLFPVVFGGGQESNLRSGTEDVPGIVGFAHALTLARERRQEESSRLTTLREYFIGNILDSIPDSRLNGHQDKRLPNNVSVSFFGIEGEAMVLMLDKKGVFASTGSACASHDLTASHVLLALGLSPEFAHGSLRFTMGKDTAKEDIDYTLSVLPGIVEALREITCIRSV